MDDFVCEKLNQWGFGDLIDSFKDEDVDKESLLCLGDQDIEQLIPKVGRRAKFKKKLKMLREEQNTNQVADNFSTQRQQQQEETATQSEVHLPATSNKGKRKSASQGESSRVQPAAKRQRETASRSVTEMKIMSDVEKIMAHIDAKLHTQDNTDLTAFLKDKIKNLKTEQREIVGFFGRTGAGKTSLINAVIGGKKLLPSEGISACTSAMIKVEANTIDSKYKAEIEFITKEEWNDELWSMNQYLGDNTKQAQDGDDDDADKRDIAEKLSALYGDEWKQKSPENLMDNKYFKEIPEFLQSTRKVLVCEMANELSEKIVKYTRNGTNQKGQEAKRWYWPVVKCVTVRVPNNNFLRHVTLVDLPGSGDCNKSRDTMWKEIVGSCSVIWIVADINRVLSEKEPWDILKSATSLLGNGGECRHIHFICTKSDHFEDFQDHSTAGKRNFIAKRNVEAKEGVRKIFGEKKLIKKHFSEECFEVYTVSAKEFLMETFLSSEFTEIPNLRDFLQILNDCHSETLNYVSGAHGILSLIHGASVRDADAKNEDVCEDLEKNLRRHLQEVSKVLDETYEAFDKCLSEGVEESKRACEEDLKSSLNPEGKSGSSFHKILKSVVQKGGDHTPKRGRPINLNMTLTSHLTDSIDEKFRRTFPNEGNNGPFNGVINKFSLDTEKLKQTYKDVELQLIFLKTEEEKIKTKLSQTIRKEKKKIYSSLMETIKELMEESYDKAKKFRGKDTLQNMRETLTTHVHESKDTMFGRAKDVMLEKLQTLKKDILKTLETDIMQSIELSLKTDDHSFPDVSEDLAMVQEFYFELINKLD